MTQSHVAKYVERVNPAKSLWDLSQRCGSTGHVRVVPGADIINVRDGSHVWRAPRLATSQRPVDQTLGAFDDVDRSKGLRRLNSDRSRQPPAQYVQPASWARFTPHVPDGMIVIPGTTLAAHSFAASSALTPALPASIFRFASVENWLFLIRAPMCSSPNGYG